ncbi:hypothetical protein AURDEDRAFT_115861 [Auricularia subglabra TFB-10046 SS5]|nr:hypothetical protein AURDEDRAFT_115861 [Auricularia subglabra TFB-10046 SS5]
MNGHNWGRMRALRRHEAHEAARDPDLHILIGRGRFDRAGGVSQPVQSHMQGTACTKHKTRARTVVRGRCSIGHAHVGIDFPVLALEVQVRVHCAT